MFASRKISNQICKIVQWVSRNEGAECKNSMKVTVMNATFPFHPGSTDSRARMTDREALRTVT